MSETKKGYFSPEVQLISYDENDIVRTSGEVDWTAKWGDVPDNQFSGNGFSS